MGWTRTFFPLLACMVLVCLCWININPTANAGERSPSLDAQYERHLASHQGLVIRADDGSRTLKALTIFTSSPAGLVSRLLLAGGDGMPPMVFTSTLSPKTGAKTSRIEDDQTGWWLETIEQINPPVADLATLMHEGRGMPPGTATPVALRAKSGVVFEGEVLSPGTEAELAPVWAQIRSTEGACAGVLAGVPSHVRTAAATLRSVASMLDELVYWRLEIGVLDTCLRAQQPAADTRERAWTVERQKLNLGLSLASPELIELAAQFQSVENAQPLTYREIATLLGVPESAIR